MDPWKEVAVRLNQRDQLEKKDSEYFHIFAQLSQLRAPNSQNETDRIAKENKQLLEENESLIRRLNSQTLNLERVDSRIAALEKSVKGHESRNAKMLARIDHLTSEIAEKNRSIEIVNDENLINQIQHNVLKDQVEELTRENEELVRRWMEKARVDAESLNSQLDCSTS